MPSKIPFDEPLFIEMARTGATNAQLRQTFSMSAQTVRNNFNRLGLPQRREGAPNGNHNSAGKHGPRPFYHSY